MQGVDMKKSAPCGEFVKSCLKVQELGTDALSDLDLPEGKTIAKLLHEQTEADNNEKEESESE